MAPILAWAAWTNWLTRDSVVDSRLIFQARLSRGDLTEAEWRVLKGLLPIDAADRGAGRPPEDNRSIINGIRTDLARRNIQAVIPGRTNRRIKIEHDRALYRERNRIERCLGRLKLNRAIATRHDQLAESFLSMVHIATARYWLKSVHDA